MTVLSDWRVPRQYGLSVQSFAQWLGDWAKSQAIGTIVGLISVEVVYALLLASPRLWWLWASVLSIAFGILLARLAPVLILPLFYKVTPLANHALAEKLKAWACRAGTPVQGVYCINLSSKTTAGNAALIGAGKSRKIVLADNLLDCYTPDQIEAVFAHELGHQVNHDPWRGTSSQAFLTLVVFFLTSLALQAGVGVYGYVRASAVTSLPFLSLVLGLLGLTFLPLTNWLSRRMESEADCYALRTTDDPSAFITTMIQLANQNLGVYRPPRWVEILLDDHPAVADRVRMAERFADTGRCSA